MGHDVFKRLEAARGELADRSAAADELGRLPDDVAKRLKDIGIVRMLQPADFGGYEADPRDFLAAVMEVGHSCPSAGWVAGVVGVHPWELALSDERLQSEVWGDDPDTWIASPYAPMGTATPVDGGYTVEGRWSFSSGTDLCDWVVLGASVPGGGTGGVPFMLHVMLPRADYEIDPDSWHVMGLEGTGSKDVVVRGAFVPSYRAIDAVKVMDGRAAAESGRTQPLYRMPWSTIFPCSVAAGLLGIAEGVLEHALEYQRSRVNAVGVAQVSDPHTRRTLGEAAAELRGAARSCSTTSASSTSGLPPGTRSRWPTGSPCGATRCPSPGGRSTRRTAPSPVAGATRSGSTNPSSGTGARCTPA